MGNIIEIKRFYKIILTISILSILIALYIEFFLGYKPCKLCIYQRIPYVLAIFITFLGISYSKNLVWLYTLLIIFFSSFLLSGYHFGIEKEIFNEFSGCTVNSINVTDKDELLELLNSKVSTSCKKVDFTIFGMSLASINLLLSLIIFILIFIVINNEKNKQK